MLCLLWLVFGFVWLILILFVGIQSPTGGSIGKVIQETENPANKKTWFPNILYLSYDLQGLCALSKNYSTHRGLPLTKNSVRQSNRYAVLITIAAHIFSPEKGQKAKVMRSGNRNKEQLG